MNKMNKIYEAYRNTINETYTHFINEDDKDNKIKNAISNIKNIDDWKVINGECELYKDHLLIRTYAGTDNKKYLIGLLKQLHIDQYFNLNYKNINKISFGSHHDYSL